MRELTRFTPREWLQLTPLAHLLKETRNDLVLAKYLRQEGAVLLCFDPKLKPYLLQLKGNFTCSRLDMLLNFKSQYTMRIYNLLKQYEGLGERQIEVDFLREILGLRENQYKRYNDFKKDILYI